VAAAHLVVAPLLGIVWYFPRLFVNAPSGRPRLTGLAALNASTHEVLTVTHRTSSTAETVCALWCLLAGTHAGLPITLILDNARSQRCALVQTVAQTWGIELLYLPTYAPKLHLIERFWKFVNTQCVDSKYYPDGASFQQAIMNCLEQAPTIHQEELKSLLTLRFQTFQDVTVLGEQQTIAQGSKKKVLSKAA
jgi:transposase